MLKGIMALGIILHHLTLQYNSSFVFLKPFKFVGFLFVGLFFFISGYGLTISMMTRKEYFSTFRYRIYKVIIPFLIANCIYGLYYVLIYYFTGYKYDKNILLIVKYSWYIYEILILYFLFFSLYKNLNFKRATIVISSILLISLIVIYQNDFSASWYKSTFAFVFGSIVAKNKEIIKKWFESKFIIKIFILSIFLVISLLVGKFLNLGIFEIFIYNNSVILFAFISLMILYKINNFNNKFLEYIGKISFEIYLYHGLLIDFFLRININDKIGTFLIIFITILIAGLVNQFNNKILNYKIYKNEIKRRI